MAEVKREIAMQIYKAAERLGADEDLLSVLGSYGDTLDDADVLALLRDYNTTGKTLHQRN